MDSFRCTQPKFESLRKKDDGVITETQREQVRVEESVKNCFNYFRTRLEVDPEVPELHKERHATYLLKGLQHLSEAYQCLDASRPWLCYWILHSLELLEITVPPDLASQTAQFLGKCQCETGGFGGGPAQLAHLAPTYAAVNALCILGTEEAYNIINRETLQKFLISRRTPEGAFTMHEGGEVDIRGAYCAASAAKLTNIVIPEMFDGTAEWIVSCQTYEGGFAGLPGLEAHGGYSFCGLAALILLGRERLCDITALLRWTASQQMSYEGGFRGRTNKLVDGCYSFWQGGAFPLLQIVLSIRGDEGLCAENWMFDQAALQEYLLICCQHPGGGLIDKPGKSRDYYHTCYCLSGMSVAQHFTEGKLEAQNVVGSPENELRPTHPVFNICCDKVMHSHDHFKLLPVPNKKAES